MAAHVVIGCADQSLAYELRAQLAEASDVEIVGVGETTSELTDLVLTRDPALVLVHDTLGPDQVHQVIRDLSIRRPASVVVVLTSETDPAALADAMDAGARGVLAYPLSFTDVQQRVQNALEWSRHMQGFVQSVADGATNRGRALVVAFSGTKGGVGTTTFTTHLAWDVRRELPSLKVLVIDLDLEKGDVTSFIEARYRTSVADLAKVSDDLSLRTVADAVFVHESGMHLLLPPGDVRETEFVTPSAIRQIVALVRQQYDLVLVDVGARVTPVQAAVVEIADEVVAVATPDLLSLRALRRNVTAWESLQVRRPEHVSVLLNRSSRADEVQPDVARRLSPSPLLDVIVPEMGKKLEASANSRSPELVTDVGWWRAVRGLGRAVGVGGLLVEPGAPPGESQQRTRGRHAAAADDGSVSVEFLGVLPALLLVCVVMWQLGWAGMTAVWTGYAAQQAARSVALHEADWQVRDAARDVFPSGMRSGVSVRFDAGRPDLVEVEARVPLVAPGVSDLPWSVTIQREVVRES
jgi:pilus assembly protein CpaE